MKYILKPKVLEDFISGTNNKLTIILIFRFKLFVVR